MYRIPRLRARFMLRVGIRREIVLDARGRAQLDGAGRDELGHARSFSLDTDDAVYLVEDLDPEIQHAVLAAVPAEDRAALVEGWDSAVPHPRMRS